MPVVGRWAYFDHAAVSPLPEPTRAQIVDWAEDTACAGDAHWSRWSRRLEECRRLGSRLLGAEPDEIALVKNTTEGINLVAEGFPWREGDNLVTLANEFPSNLYPWLNLASRGVETRRVEPRPDGRIEPAELAAACDGRTRLIAASWVGYASGWRTDLDTLAEIAHSIGAQLFVDGIQGLGIFPLDVRQTPIDYLAADGHKWLLGPEGAGLLYVRRDHLDALRPLGLGWHSVVHAGDYARSDMTLKPSAARYEGGSHNMPGFVGLAASLEVLLEYGTAALAEQILSFTDQACERLAQAGATIRSCREGAGRSGIVSFELPGRDPAAVRRQCLDKSVVLSARAGRLRIAPHAYNNGEDLDRLLDALTR